MNSVYPIAGFDGQLEQPFDRWGRFLRRGTSQLILRFTPCYFGDQVMSHCETQTWAGWWYTPLKNMSQLGCLFPYPLVN